MNADGRHAMKELSIGGMRIAPGVVETIISVAMSEVEGVTAVGVTSVNGLVAAIAGKGSAQGIDVDVDANGQLAVGIHVEVSYGQPLPEIAARIRQESPQNLVAPCCFAAAVFGRNHRSTHCRAAGCGQCPCS